MKWLWEWWCNEFHLDRHTSTEFTKNVWVWKCGKCSREWVK